MYYQRHSRIASSPQGFRNCNIVPPGNKNHHPAIESSIDRMQGEGSGARHPAGGHRRGRAPAGPPHFRRMPRRPVYNHAM